MSSESANAPSNMSDSVSSDGDSGQQMTNETEEYDDVSEVYSLEIFETVKRGLRTERRTVLHLTETKQCLQAILTFIEAERLTPEEFRASREFMTQVFPILWKRLLREDPCENLIVEFEGWGQLFGKIAMTLLEKSTEIDFKAYHELALRAFSCVEHFFDADTLIYKNLHFPDAVPSPDRSPERQRPEISEPAEASWPKSLAIEIIDSSLELVCKLVDRFFSHQIFEEYTDSLSEDLLEIVLGLYCRMTPAGIEKEVFSPLCDIIKSSIADVRMSPVENFSFTFLSSPNFLDFLHRIIYFTESVESAEETAGKFRRNILKEELKQGNFKSRLTAVRCLANYLDAVSVYEDPIPLQRLQMWLNQEDIVGMMLGSHVEKVHYAEHVLMVLERMVKAEILETEHIDSLWSLVEPDGVFEGLRENVVNMTGVLAKQMNTDHVRYIIERVGKGIGSSGYVSKNFMILHSILQREDPSVDYVEPLLNLFWQVLLEMAKLDDTGKTFSFKECIRNYFDRGCHDLPEKYLQQSIEILESGQISMTMVQVFADMYHLARDCYPHRQLNVDPLELLISALERCHCLLSKEQSCSSSVVDMFNFCRIIRVILVVAHSLHCPLTLDLIKRFWDICVLNPLHEDARHDALLWLHERMEYDNQFLSVSVMFDFLHERMCQLDVSDVDPTAFACFRTCFSKVVNYYHDTIDIQSPMDYLWKIFLNTQIEDVVNESKSMIISLYFHFERLDEFLQRLMTSLMDCLTELAGLPPETTCTDVIDRLYDERIQIRGTCGVYISRCIDALDFSLSQAAPEKQFIEKQFALITALKNILSQSEKMNKILVFLADSCCSASLREGVCLVLDSLPVYQPLLLSLTQTLNNTQTECLTESIDKQLFPATGTNHTVEQTRYAFTALKNALRCVTASRDDFESIGASCLLYILDVIKRVDVPLMHPDEVSKSQQRLHSIGVEIVGQLMWQLNAKSSASAHSSPNREQMRQSELYMVMESMEEQPAYEGGDSMMISESSRDGFSDVMDFSAARQTIETRRSNPPVKEETIQESTSAKEGEMSVTEGVDQPEQKRRHQNLSPTMSPEASDLGGSMSVDSVPEPPLTRKSSKEEQSKNVQLEVLGRVIEYFVEVMDNASRGWTPAVEPVLMDIQLVEMAVDQLIKMIEQSTQALEAFLAYPDIVGIVMRSILNPLPKIRHSIWQLATMICSKSASAGDAVYQWARSNRKQADKVSAYCAEYYMLIEQYVQARFQPPTPEQAEQVRVLWNELIQDIRDSPYEELAEGMKLCRQLRLCLVLMNVVDSDAQAAFAEGDLVFFLIQEILFPEAVLLRKAQVLVEQLPTDSVQEIMKTKNNPECARHAAFDLLLKLIRSGNMNLKWALDCLNTLHFGRDAVVREVAGSNATRSPHGYVGLQNGGATCYINSIIQQLFMQPAVRDTILAAPTDQNDDDQSRTAFSALQKVFGYLQASSRRCYYPRDFLETFTHSDGTRIDVRQHHDALEFFQRTQELVDEQLVRHGMKPIIKNVVGTTHVQQIICKEDGETYISASEQTYTSCSLDIVGKTNLRESLDAYVQGELLEGSDAYHCEPIGKKVPALKRLCLKSPPMNLVLQLKRFEMDYQLMETYKNNDRFEFPLELNIFSYTASGLMQNEGITKHNGSDDSPKLFPAQCHYHLKGIVVHTGEIDGGHYYSFIKEKEPGKYRHPKDCTWWRFDDSFVEMWDIERLEEDCFGGSTDLEMHDTQRIPKMNNAYILIYEHVPFAQEGGSGSPVASQSKDPTPQMPKTTVPPLIEREVLNDNLVLLAACRLAERNYMYFILKLLKTMPSKDVLNRRKMRRVTPQSSRGDINYDSSPASVNSAEKSSEESFSGRGEGTDQLLTTVETIASIVCEYIFKVILTPCVFLHTDGIEWGDSISVIVENTLSRDIALQKMVEHTEHCFRCLVLQGNEAAKEFLSHFLTKIIQSLSNPENQGNLEALNIRLMKFLMVVLEYLDHRWNLNFDVSRVMDISCLIVEVLHGHGDRSVWISLIESFLWKALRFSKIVYLNGRVQFIRSLDTTNKCIVRLINSCLEHPEPEEGDVLRTPLMGVEPSLIHVLEKFNTYRQIFKSLLRPIVLAEPGAVRLLTLMSWNSDQGSLLLLDCMQDLFQEMENYDGEQFVLVVNAMIDLATVHDRFYPQKLTYLLFKGDGQYTPWLLIKVKIPNPHRWKLLYLLMLASNKEEKMKDDMMHLREWEQVLDWMRRDMAAIPVIPGETWLDKNEIYTWACQFADL